MSKWSKLLLEKARQLTSEPAAAAGKSAGPAPAETDWVWVELPDGRRCIILAAERQAALREVNFLLPPGRPGCSQAETRRSHARGIERDTEGPLQARDGIPHWEVLDG